MNDLISAQEFNKLPNFCVAVESPQHNHESLVSVGKFICDLHLSHIVGVGLLHRHFPLHDGEVLKRDRVGESTLTYCTKSTSADFRAVSWKIDPINRCAIPMEIAGRSEESLPYPTPEQLHILASAICRLELCETYGLVYLPAHISTGKQLYELTDDVSRVALVSPMKALAQEKSNFSQSVFAFKETRDGVALDRTTDCTICIGCQPSTPPEHEQREPANNKYANLFGLGIDLEEGTELSTTVSESLVRAIIRKLAHKSPAL